MKTTHSNYRWIILAVISFAVFVSNYAQYQLSPVAANIIADYGLNASQFSSVFSAPMVLSIVFSLLSGVIADRFGVKKVLAVGYFVTCAGLIFRIFTTSYLPLYSSMILAGCGLAFLNSNSGKIIGSWFSPEKVGTIMGVYLSFSTLAMTIGLGTTAMMPSYHTAFVLTAALSAVLFVLICVFMKNAPQNAAAQEMPAVSVKEGLKIVTGSRSVWLIALCLVGVMGNTVLLNSNLPTALASRGVDAISSGIYSSAMSIGNLLGALLVPIIASKLGRSKPVMIILSLVGTVGSCFAWLAPIGPALIACWLVTGFSISGMMPLLMGMPVQLPEIGPRFAGTAGGFTSTLQLLGAVVLPTYVFVPIANGNFQMLFFFAGACMLLVALLSVLLPDTAKKER